MPEQLDLKKELQEAGEMNLADNPNTEYNFGDKEVNEVYWSIIEDLTRSDEIIL